MTRASSHVLSLVLAVSIGSSAARATADPGAASLNGVPLTWSTFAGGASTDYGAGVTTDASGNVYLVGTTSSSDYPTSPGAFQRVKGLDRDVFVTKLRADGTTLVWSTLLGGNGTDNGLTVAVDAAGNVYVAGSTSSTDFPTTPGALRRVYAGGSSDGFVAKVAADGSGLLYSTYLGGGQNELVLSIAVDGSGNATAGGYSGSTDFPTTAGALRTSRSGGFPDVADGFVSKLNPTGSQLVYSTYVGVDGGTDEVFGVALDAQGRATVTGMTESPVFPTTTGAFDRTYGRYWDGFVARLNATGSALVYSTYLGGTGDDQPWGVALDSNGYAYVTGWTSSADFPATSGAFQRTFGGGTWDSFVARLAPDGGTLTYATYLGGAGSDQAYALTLATGGRACVVGTTDSGNFPISAGAYDGSADGGQDAFVTCLSSTGGALSYSSFLGASGSDIGRAVAVRPDLNLALMGYSNSSSFPITPFCYDPTLNGAGTFDCFATVIDAGLAGVTAVPPGTPAVLRLAPPTPNPFVTGTSVELSLERPAHVSVRVFDLGGRLVRVLEDRDLPSGRHGWAWDGRDVRGADPGSGMFYVEASADGERMVRSVVKLR
jgi:hypothetical protein